VSLLSTPLRRRAAFVVGLAIVAALPLAARLLRAGGPARCAWDGVAIEPRFSARLLDADPDAAAESFCCLCCLVRRLRTLATLPTPPARVVVTDEASASEVDGNSAWYVESAVPTNRSTECRVHAFADEAAAARHAAAFHGTVRGRGLSALLEDAPGGR